MKRVLLVLLVVLFSTMVGVAQENKVDSKIEKTLIKNIDSITKSGVTYKLHVGSGGGKYIIRTSKKTGNKYKQYFKEEQLEKLLVAMSLKK